jgi:omega-6 fatty acid desaturase (delta-12 desaturase)
MTHPAHHLDVRIPLYRIDAAERALGASVHEQPFSLGYAFDCMRRCKLYDYGSQRWMDFGGHYTSAARPERAVETVARVQS